MPCLTPCLLTTHDIYLMSREDFCSALQARRTLSPASANQHRADRPNHPMAAAQTIQIKSSQGHHAITFNLFSRAAAASLHFSSCDWGWWQLQAKLCQPCTQSWASPLQPSRGCRLPTEKPARGWHHRSLSATLSRHLDGNDFSLVGTAGSSFTCLICCTCQKHFPLPLTAFTAAVIFYDAIYSTPSKPISVFIAKQNVKNG